MDNQEYGICQNHGMSTKERLSLGKNLCVLHVAELEGWSYLSTWEPRNSITNVGDGAVVSDVFPLASSFVELLPMELMLSFQNWKGNVSSVHSMLEVCPLLFPRSSCLRDFGSYKYWNCHWLWDLCYHSEYVLLYAMAMNRWDKRWKVIARKWYIWVSSWWVANWC